MTPCDAHFENGQAVCSCTEAERFNSAPEDAEGECSVCINPATRRLPKMPELGWRGQVVCEKCYEKAVAKVDPDVIYEVGL